MKYIPEQEEFERCITCGALTDVPISMPIDLRDNYEMGCGQLCRKCADKQRKAINGKDMLTEKQIVFAVEQSREDKK